jgi:hypothetical protein
MTDLTQAVVIWTFLIIFALSGLISILSIIGWVIIEKPYKWGLYSVLMVQVIGCVIKFGNDAFHTSPETNLQTILLTPKMGWDWQYAEKGWHSRIRFTPNEKGKFNMIGNTIIKGGDGTEKTIINWESSEPFEVEPKAKAITFKAYRIWTEEAAKLDTNLRWETGKKRQIEITVNLDMSLRGGITSINTADTWGLVMTPAFQ